MSKRKDFNFGKAVEKITGTESTPDKMKSISDRNSIKRAFTEQDTKPTKKRKTTTRKGRVKFTTMLNPKLKDTLSNIAENKDMSIADVLEQMIKDYFNLK